MTYTAVNQPDLRMAADRLRYDEAKHYRGPVCVHGHDHDGHSWRHIGHGNCVDFTRERARSWRIENPDRAAANTKRRDSRRSREVRARWPIALACESARNRSRAMGIEPTITPDSLRAQWIAQDGRCFWTGEPISFAIDADRHPLRPSLEKLVPNDGYVVGNVVWASNFANRARSDCPAVEFCSIMQAMIGDRFLTTMAYDIYLRQPA